MKRFRASQRVALVGAMVAGLLLTGVTPALANSGAEEAADLNAVTSEAPATGNGTISGTITDPQHQLRGGETLTVVAFQGRNVTDHNTVLNWAENAAGGTSYTISNLPRVNNITLVVMSEWLGMNRVAEQGWPSAYNKQQLSYVDLTGTQHATGIDFVLKPGFADMCMIYDACAKFYNEIMWMLDTGLSTGVRVISSGDGNTTRHYKPKDTVTREAMAAFLYRLNSNGASAPAGYTVPPQSPFADVPTNHKFYKEIAWMHSSGLSTGIKRGNSIVYAPKSGVSREAMAAFMYRMTKPSYTLNTSPHFTDVQRGHKFFTQIQWMYDSGLSTGVKQPSGKPAYLDQARVSREAMAAFLYRSEH